MISPLLAPEPLERLRIALTDYTVDAVQDRLGLAGQAALQRGDLAAVERHTRHDAPTAGLIRLFVLGLPMDEFGAGRALRPFTVDDGVAAELLERSGGEVRALLDLRPYAETSSPLGAAGSSWWVVSDFGTDVRPGPLRGDHVLGVGPASTTLAQATVRRPVRSALDVGVGCGVQSLHLSRHATSVTATDISERALRMAATTAALNGLRWDLRLGTLLEPVSGRRFDLVVANPPFVVSPGLDRDHGGFDYRDSGLAGDGVCAALVRDLVTVIADGGTAQLLANWIIPSDEPWEERLAGWFESFDGTAWVWQREVADPAEYVSLWLRDAGIEPEHASYARRYDDWLAWFEQERVAAIGMGLISLRHTGMSTQVICEDVPQAVEQPVGAAIGSWLDRHAWLAARSDDDLTRERLRVASDLILTSQATLSHEGWQVVRQELRQSHGLRWELEVDDAVASLAAGCGGNVELGIPLGLLAAEYGVPATAMTSALMPVMRDLIGRGFLLPRGPTS